MLFPGAQSQFKLNLQLADIIKEMLYSIPAFMYDTCLYSVRSVAAYLQLSSLQTVRSVQGLVDKFFASHGVRHSHHNRRGASRQKHTICIVDVLLSEVRLAAPVGVVFAKLAAHRIAAKISARSNASAAAVIRHPGTDLEARPRASYPTSYAQVCWSEA